MGADQSSFPQIIEGYRDGRTYISFFVNGKEYNVDVDGFGPEFGPNYVLVDFLRDKLGLTGTKYMCREGGCGACTVMIKSLHPKTGQQITRSTNSCLLPLYACDGLDITTIEGIGNVKKGFHPIQDRLVKFGGTQCGFCSPGFVMNMYSYAQVNPRFTGGNVEYSLDGNICRCTGYRSIIDAFKSLSKNVTEDLRQKCLDIEECYKCPLSVVNQDGENSDGDAQIEIISTPRNMHVRSRFPGGEEWIKITSLPALFKILQRFKYEQTKYKLIAGNTGAGVFKRDGPYSSYIDINDIPDLHEVLSDKSGMVLGAGTSMTEAIDQFMSVAKTDGFVYASEFAKHFRRIASLTVRNCATLAGNLMLKHDHPDFASDVFILFESIGATLRIGSSVTLYRDYSLLEFLSLDMTGKIIMSVHLPTFGTNHFFRCFKIARRYQNSHAHVNSAIMFNVDKKNGFKVLSKPAICLGGINSSFVHANATEEYLIGKELNSITLREALQILEREAVPNENPPSPSPGYRLGLAQSLLYKYILGLLRDSVNPTLRTGADDVDRGLNTGTQTFDTDKSKFPLYQPIPKLESYPQVSGQAEFINDIQIGLNELFGAFVLTTVANGTLEHVNASQALQSPGVVAFITAKDIPGSNNHAVFGNLQEEIFITNKVQYCGQPIGLIVAKNRQAAFQARDKVIIKYKDIKKPTLDIEESVKLQTISKKRVSANLAFPCRGINEKLANEILENMKEKELRLETQDKTKNLVPENLYTVKGEFITRGQYHFHMETQTCLCIPKEDGMDVYSSTQSMDNVQAAIAGALHRPSNSINLAVRRIGGGFGAKSSKANHIATACAVAAQVTSKPVRVVLDLETNMQMIGKRLPYLTKYEAIVDHTGKIQELTAFVYCDTGSVANEPSSLFFTICMQSCYKTNQWNVTPGVALTDTAPNTYCRSPGSAQAIAAIENIMEHIAHIVGKDPFEVRQVNFIRKGDPLIGIPGAKLMTANPLPEMVNELKKTSDYLSRRNFVDSFNKANRWRKRGISIVPQRIPIHYADYRLPTFISVYHTDGTVAVSHGGIECGQGLNSKVAQVVAYTLNIPIDNVIVKPTNTTVSPNTAFTAASVTSEMICHSAQKACRHLLEKMEPAREQLEKPTWQELVAACNSKGILLTAQHQDLAGDITSYDVWGATVVEVEVDVLTGDYRIIRADIIEDAGYSLNPLLDIGQIEGAFIMGLGWLLTENLVYDKDTGELLTDSTWHYKPMLPADIPEDLRVTMLQNTPNPFGVLSSKATAEPPLNMSVSVMFALRNAIDSARQDVGNFEWYSMNAPVSREDIRSLALTSAEQFVL